MKIEVEDVVLISLHSPREKILGVLREINASGIYVRGIDLNTFDEFIQAIQNAENFYGMSDQFLPMWRIEKIIRDEPVGDISSMHEQFKKRTGRKFWES